jgi:transposase-like protein
MKSSKGNPTTLLEAVRFFSDLDVAHEFFVNVRWPDGKVTCPHCGGTDVRYLASYRRYECKAKHPKRQFTVKVGTIMEDSPLGLDKWAAAFWLEVNAKNSISSYEVHRALGVTQKSAWFMLHRIRLAVQSKSFVKFSGPVESDESYIGGAAENMHPAKRRERIKAPGPKGKTIVHGILNRDGSECSKVAAKVIPDAKRPTLTKNLHESVELGAIVYTDTHPAYHKLGEDYVHAMIDHAKAYVEGECHTNGLENFWALFKRCINGTHVAVEPFHLQAYLDSEIFRFNNRRLTDGARFMLALAGMTGKRLTYAALIGTPEDHTSATSNVEGDASKPN